LAAAALAAAASALSQISSSRTDKKCLGLFSSSLLTAANHLSLFRPRSFSASPFCFTPIDHSNARWTKGEGERERERERERGRERERESKSESKIERERERESERGGERERESKSESKIERERERERERRHAVTQTRPLENEDEMLKTYLSRIGCWCQKAI
jgi:hypothetical protein